MAATHGKNAKFRITDAGSTLRDISAYLTDAGLPRSADTAEVSTLGMNSKAYIPGLLDGTIPISGPWDATVDGYLAGILGMERPFEYEPAGTGTGKVKYSGDAILTAYEPSTGVSDAGRFSGTFQVTGDVTREIQA